MGLGALVAASGLPMWNSIAGEAAMAAPSENAP